MRYQLTLLLFVFSILTVTAQNRLSIANAEVSFIFVSQDVEGTLTGFNSNSIIDLETIENSNFKGSVNVETISTGNSIRNWSLRRGKYFDVATFPKINFESTRVEKDGDNITVRGKLTIKDITKNVVFQFEKKDVQLIGKTTLYSSDFGITIKKKREDNKVLVTLRFELK